jgi:GNAT superfamily N-acetyltransferase
MEDKFQQTPIRLAQIPDFEALAALDQSVWDDEQIPDGKHVWRHWVEMAHCWVAQSEQTIVGTALLLPTKVPDLLWVHKLFVRRDFQSKGIGKALLGKALAYSDSQNQRTELTVSPQNKNAIKLYQTLGYEKKLIPDFYGRGKDRFLMARNPART